MNEKKPARLARSAKWHSDGTMLFAVVNLWQQSQSIIAVLRVESMP